MELFFGGAGGLWWFAEGEALEVTAEGVSPAVDTERWRGVCVWNVGRLPRGVLGRKHYNLHSEPSFKQHS